MRWALLAFALLFLATGGLASYATHYDSPGLRLWQVTLELDEGGNESYSIPQVSPGKLVQVDYWSGNLNITDNNTVTISRNATGDILDAYNVTEGNSSRNDTVLYITDQVDFEIVNGTRNATMKLNLFFER